MYLLHADSAKPQHAQMICCERSPDKETRNLVSVPGLKTWTVCSRLKMRAAAAAAAAAVAGVVAVAAGGGGWGGGGRGR